ncbi:MAG TPA: MoxR family ATPase, partial [Nocardioides sp.]|nr:MoxR family ATPase [Nocardioides sp.]
MENRLPASADDVAARLGETGYLCDGSLATVTFLALRMERPLLLEGEPGTGKTALAEAIAETLGLPLVRLQCYEGIDATQALYDWDFPRQILHLRALEAAGGNTDVEEAEKSLYDERFLLARPVLAALQQSPAVLLVDEVDRADDEFEAFLLEVLSTYQVSIPELGTVAAATPPIVVLTSNRTRELHDALKRRCLYHWIEHPGLEREVQIVRSRAPEVSEELARQVVGVVQQLRDEGLQKPPGVSETLD